MSADCALEMRGITKDFPGVRALRHVNFRVQRGEVHCLLGENGAGKSTLMKILDGFYPSGAYQGEIVLNGNPVELRSPHDARRKGIGFVPQEIHVIEHLSVAENIFVGYWNEGGGILFEPRRLVARAARAGVGIYSVAPFYAEPPRRAGLLFGYAALTEGEIRAGVRRLAELL